MLGQSNINKLVKSTKNTDGKQQNKANLKSAANIFSLNKY